MDIIENFLDKKLITNNNTKKIYRCYIKKYFRLINKDIDTYFKQDIKEIEKDLETIYLKLRNQEKTSLLVLKTFFNSVKQFMFRMDKKTKTLDFWDTLKDRTRNASPVTDDETPNREDIKKILHHGGTRARSMFLIMASTGCRIGELIALYPEDIKLNENPVRVHFKRSFDYKEPSKTKLFTKNKGKHDGFLTHEATEAYLAYMKERDKLFKKALRVMPKKRCPIKYTGNKTNDNKLIDEYIKKDKRIFPYSDNTARLIWLNMIKNTELYLKDSDTNRLTMHPHCLRKFFRSYLNNVDLAEHIMGHGGYLTSYRDMQPRDVGKEFLKYAHNVTIFESGKDTEKLNNLQEQFIEKDKQITSMTQTINDLTKQVENYNKLIDARINEAIKRNKWKEIKEGE
jgi:integrase